MAVIKSASKKIKTQISVVDCLKYIAQDKKCSEISYYDGAKSTADFFRDIRKMYDKDDKILAHHYFQSFNPEDNVTPELAHKIGLEFIELVAPNYAVVVATHKDKDHIHNHFLINSVNTATGYKWHDNMRTIHHMRQVSDNLCRKYNLHIVEESDKKAIDQTTYQLAIKGKSWKIELVQILDEAVENCHSKLDFMDFINQHGFKINYYNRNITVWKEGEKRIRVDTLAKQFGEKYKKENLEKAMGYTDGDLEYIPNSKNPTITEPYYGEWARYENWFFQHRTSVFRDLPTVFENFPLEELLNADGENSTVEIDLLDLVRLKKADFFFSAEKKDKTATLHYKKYNHEKARDIVTFLNEVEKIVNKNDVVENLSKNPGIEKINSEKVKNLQTLNEIKKQSALSGEKPLYRVISAEKLKKLKSEDMFFAYFPKDERFNIVYLKSDEEKINNILKPPLKGQNL